MDRFPILYNKFNPEHWKNYYELHTKNFKKELSDSYIDGMGIIGENLFEITLDNQISNSKCNLTNVRFGILESECYCLMCPELESFISLVLWMNYENESNYEKKEKYYTILEDYLSKSSSEETCVLTDNYRIRTENFGDLVPFKGTIKKREKKKSYFDWERVPFLKRSAEVSAIHSSPPFMPTFPDSKTKIQIFTMPFKINQYTKYDMELIIPSATTSKTGVLNLGKPSNEVYDKLKSTKTEWYIGLFIEKIININENYTRNFEIIDISSAGVIDVIGHLISQKLYYNYLKEFNLEICSNYELERLFKFHVQKMYEQYNEDVWADLDTFYRIYLEKYFLKIHGKVYYKPYIFKELNFKEYGEFIKYLNDSEEYQKKIYEDTNVMENINLAKKFSKNKSYFEFLKKYSKYSKYDLINRIFKNGGRQWRI
ncbi:hypothetical protein [Methanococcus voltae]|uniref:MATH domain-containing protein n=1 Tax=Methanococcus voltae (strain ATCC BAA-1334 / A3) TaxID=456320 RepID=D7DSR7_METV3|nr:hypothetical protein [Methanococcus voltae]MCS3901778.1 hypothetical protein [Methanococcus voltae]